MKRVFAVVTSLILFAAADPGRAAPPGPEVSASHTRFGFEGQDWELTLGQGGKLWVKRPRQGDQLSTIRALAPDVLRGLESVLGRERFCELDEQYGAVVMDGPERRMSARCGAAIRTVTLYTFDAKQALTESERSEIRRALRVWIAVRGLFEDPGALDSRPEDKSLLDALAPASARP